MFNYDKRLEKLRQAMIDWGADLLFLNPSAEWYWVTGASVPEYHSALKVPGDWISGVIVSQDQDPTIIVHEASKEGMGDKTWVKEIRVLKFGQDPQTFITQILSTFSPKGKTIAVAKTAWTETLLGLKQAAPEARFITATAAMLDKVRQIKDEDELQLMREVAEVTDAALRATFTQLKPGMTEREITVEVEYQMRKSGAEALSFSPSVVNIQPGKELTARDPNAKILPGTALAFDMGIIYKNYASDFGRTFFVGEPSALARQCYASLSRSLQTLTKQLGDGNMTCEEAAQFVINSIEADGFGKYHYHPGLGHGVGLTAHESPWVFPGVKDKIRKGMCLALEPKIYIPGEFYMRIEDVVGVGDDHSEFFTKYTYEPQVIE